MKLKGIYEKILPFGILGALCFLFLASLIRFRPGNESSALKFTPYTGEIGVKGILNGSFQEEWGKWFTNNFYGQSMAVSCRNQIKYSLFHDGSGGWICGKDRYLFSASQVERYLGRHEDEVATEEYEKCASNVSQLQTSLESAGKKFVYILTPNKVEIYPEYLPWYEQIIVRYGVDRKRSAHVRLVEAFDKYGVHYYDTTEDILRMKEEADFDAFAKTGHHWTFTACAAEMNAIFSGIGPMTAGIDYPQINVVGISDEVCHYDLDILNTQNVLYKHNQDVRYQSPVIEYPKISDTNVYWFGTSYGALFTIAMYQGVEERAFDSLTFQQYFTGLFTFNEEGLLAKDFTAEDTPEDIGVMEHIRDNDLIVMEQQADSGIYPTHVKFVDYVNQALLKANQ